jgi:hypothetical protein
MTSIVKVCGTAHETLASVESAITIVMRNRVLRIIVSFPAVKIVDATEP